MHCRLSFAAVAIVCTSLFASQDTAAELLVNGSFEQHDSLGAPSYPDVWEIGVNVTLTGWTVDAGASGRWLLQDSVTYGPATDGSFFINASPINPTPFSLSQSFSTDVGEQYFVTFDVANRAGNDTTAQLIASVDNAGSQGVTFSATDLPVGDLTANAWSQEGFAFTADSTTTTLTFTGEDIAGLGFYVDNVSVSDVPEPASLVLMGVGGVLLLRRGRA